MTYTVYATVAATHKHIIYKMLKSRKISHFLPIYMWTASTVRMNAYKNGQNDSQCSIKMQKNDGQNDVQNDKKQVQKCENEVKKLRKTHVYYTFFFILFFFFFFNSFYLSFFGSFFLFLFLVFSFSFFLFFLWCYSSCYSDITVRAVRVKK